MGKFDGISVCIIGAGKTAFMAKVASVLASSPMSSVEDQKEQTPVPVLIRFCGTSPGSKNARSLMVSLCAA
jgi:hypothetical protein